MATTVMGAKPNTNQKKVLYWVIAIGAVILATIVLALSRMTATPSVDQNVPAAMTTPSGAVTEGGYNNGVTASGESMQGTGTEVPGTYNNGHPNTDPVQPDNAPIQ